MRTGAPRPARRRSRRSARRVPGACGSLPTSARRCQQRTHFGWVLAERRGSKRLRRSSAPRPRPGRRFRCTRAWLVISRKRSSSARAAKARSLGRGREDGRPPPRSGAPICPAVRSRSSSRATSVLSAMKACQSMSEPRSAPDRKRVPGVQEHRLAALTRQKAPGLLGREAQDRRQPAHHGARRCDTWRSARSGAAGWPRPWCRGGP